MSAIILDGKILAAELKENLRKEIALLKLHYGQIPVAVSIVTGDDPGALSYASSQKKTAIDVGIDYQLKCLSSEVTTDEFKTLIHQLNHDSKVHAVLINKPLPAHLDFSELTNWIDAHKDAEGLNVANLGRLFFGKTKLIPCTAASIMEHLSYAKVNLKGKEAVIVGRSEIVGKPMIMLLLASHATVTICHSATDAAGKLPEHLQKADVIIAAVGKAGFLKGEWIKPGAVVIDVGINRVDGKITGDVDFPSVSKVAGAITPVPGGIGPVTAIMLMKNVVEAFKEQQKSKVID